ncbi:uncharacterized protein [Phaseolus vulgaris]|uniref:uncharacterized protein n=1 Tax=Phaseolus vulgaris TaxID=3885 RepID=UPI0035CA6F18
MIVYAFRKGVSSGPFSKSLFRNRPKTFAEIRRRAVEHIASEGEVYEKRTTVAPTRPRAHIRAQPARVHEAATGGENQDRKRPYEARRTQPRSQAERRKEGRKPLRHNFVVELKDLIIVPNIGDRLRPPVKTDKVLGPHKESWCEFHEAFGHHINNCLALGYQLDELVKTGFLKDYLVGSAATTVPTVPEEGHTHEMPVHGEVHTISGGFSGGGPTASQRKKYVRSVSSVAEEFSDDPWESDLVFTRADLRDVVPHDNDPVVISVVTAGRKVHRVLVDQGSSADVRQPVEVCGYLELRTTFTDGAASRTESIRYLVVNANSAYNILLGRPALNRLRAVPSTRHMKMKRPDLSSKMIVIKSDQEEARKCYKNSLKTKRGMVMEEQDEVAAVISRHIDAFTWTAADMPCIDPDFLCHHLTMNTNVRPVRQRRRKFNEERCLVVKEETQKLLSAGHIREIQYPEWLANVVLVKKANGKWRMCVDFTDLNKACPKDSYPLPNIDALVDSASGCKIMSFLDAFSGYNQIKMHPRDECKTTFMTETCNYCYKVMPFGLKNAGATYQRLMDKVLAHMLGRNVQAYMDDMVVTSHEKEQHSVDLEELFATIARYCLKLNLEKCVFGVESRKFLGFMLTETGIEANPDKCAAIIAMRSPTSVKEVQQLTGRMAASSRFVSTGGERGHPYFQCLKRNNCFAWTDECEAAFLKLKEYLVTPPVLCKPRIGVPLRLYFAVTEWAISSVLVQEQDQVQRPIYFVSKALQGPESRYQSLEKAALAVVFSARMLRHYFHNFTVVVMTNLPIQKVLQKPDVARRMVRWAVELSEFDIQYEPRGSIKGQVYADFVAKLSPGGNPQEMELGSQWMLSVDGSSNQQGSGAGIILEGPNGVLIEQALRFTFKVSNNQVEYEALIAGMLLAKEMGAQSLLAKSDSQLVTGQVTGEYQAKDPQMAMSLRYVEVLKGAFDAFELVHVPREQNARADLLAKMASSGKRGR